MKTVTRSKTVVQEYDVYIANDSTEFDSRSKCEDYELRQKGERITCPECHGKGYKLGRYVEAYDNYDIGHVEAHYEHDTCEKCQGKGYLEKKVTWV